MTNNDFLNYLFNLQPTWVALLIFLWGVGSLLIVAAKTKTIKTVLFKNPGIVVGDFFLLPIAGGLITFFYQQVTNPVPVNNPLWTLSIMFISLLLTIFSALRFKLLNILWLPHGLFYLFMSYIVLTFISKGLWQLIHGGTPLLWLIWILVVFAVTTHQLLGILWSKKFPL
ncbi:hypothetical protein HYW46_06665 [Candidatus Daviesbacteria bacterium]|nr:hypothetical protein [Candidatus Daviesbacteria bacterium]